MIGLPEKVVRPEDQMTTITATALDADTTKTKGTETMDLRENLGVIASYFRWLFRKHIRTHAEVCMRRFGEECDC